MKNCYIVSNIVKSNIVKFMLDMVTPLTLSIDLTCRRYCVLKRKKIHYYECRLKQETTYEYSYNTGMKKKCKLCQINSSIYQIFLEYKNNIKFLRKINPYQKLLEIGFFYTRSYKYTIRSMRRGRIQLCSPLSLQTIKFRKYKMYARSEIRCTIY